jgi:hypothetical protein
MTNTNELETPENKLKAIQQQIAIYQKQAKELEDQITHNSKEAHQRFMEAYQELTGFAKTINGLGVKLDAHNDIVITYHEGIKEIFTYHYLYKNDFPRKTTNDVKEELTTAIAIADQLYGKIEFKRTYEPKALFNPIRLSGNGIVVSFDKQADDTFIIKAEKTKHTYDDGFIVSLNNTTTLKTYNDIDNDCVNQTICDTRVMTDFNQLHPLLEDVIRNIDSYQSKTIN